MPGDLALLHFANSTLGPLGGGGPGAAGPLRFVEGSMNVVDHGNQRMLRASTRSTLLLSLPSVLPQDFTLEFDLVPKQCCQPEDFAVEGTTTINQGPASANIMWSREAFRVVGGGPSFDKPMPDALSASIPGVLTNIMLTFRGDQLTMYTNGQLVYTLPNQKFVRSRVLRVFLGGQNDTDRAVYLARLRVAAGALTPTAVAGTSPPTPSGGAATASSASGLAGTTAQPLSSFAGNVNVALGSAGPIVRWTQVVTRASYKVVRWKADDPICCVNSSPASPMLPAPPWQDTPPSLPGTYVYQVTAFTAGGPFVSQGQFVYQGSGGQNIAAPSAGTPVQPATSTAAPVPTVSAPVAGTAGTVPAGLTISVVMGASGPVVSWNPVPGATGYVVTRVKSDDANCCNTSSGSSPIAGGSWQDQTPTVSGTFVYTVTALTTAGSLQGSAQFAYTAPATAIAVGPVTGTATASPSPVATTQPPSGTTQPSGGPGMPTDPCASTSGTTTGSSAMTSTSTATAGSAPACTGRYRVTLTGFHTFVTTLEPTVAPDGRGDEVYAAAAAVLWKPTSMTIGSRAVVKTREYGDLGTASMYPNRLQAGSMTPQGGIWTGNGPEQVPQHYSPNGSSIPVHAADQFPMLVWEGTLTDGSDALLVVPTLWERDIDPVMYGMWETHWRASPLASLFSDPTVSRTISDPALTQIMNPLTALGTPLDVPLADLMGSVRDHPIGTQPVPALAPIVGRYTDRFIILTRQKLASLNVGGATLLPIQYVEPQTVFTKGHYTLYLRIERLP